MQVSAQRISPVLLELDVEITADRVRSELDKAYAKLAKRAKISGFRPGRAPRQVLSQMYGSSIRADVAQRLVDETYPSAVREQSVQTVSQPTFEPSKLLENKPFTYKARVEVVPEIGEVKYEGLVAKRPKAEVDDDTFKARLDELRRQNSTLEPVTEARGIEAGDVATIDLNVLVDGKEIADAGARGFQAEFGDNSILPELEAGLLGSKPGETVDVQIKMPDTHPNPQLKGQDATFRVTITELKRRELPELDDEFAKDLGEHETLADLEKDLRDEIAQELENEAEHRVAEQLVAELVKANPIDVPPSLVQRQAQVSERELLTHARQAGQTMRSLPSELKAQVLKESETKVRAGLLMAEIAKQHSIKIGEPEIEEGLKELAEQTGKNIAKLRAEYREASKREMLVGMILENKVLDIVESKAKIEDE